MEVGLKGKKLNMVLKNHEYDDKIPTSSEYYGRPTRWDSMR